MNNRQYYRNKKIEFKKITVEIEKDLYEKLVNIRCDYFDARTFKEIINTSLRIYLNKESL